jgi:hypothetical protein
VTRLSIVVPVYNEAQTIEQVLELDAVYTLLRCRFIRQCGRPAAP